MERPLSADTDLEAERVQLELLRRASVAERLRLAFSLSDAVLRMARDALRRLHPADSDAENAVRFVFLHYGSDLGEGVAARLGVDCRRLLSTAQGHPAASLRRLGYSTLNCISSTGMKWLSIRP